MDIDISRSLPMIQSGGIRLTKTRDQPPFTASYTALFYLNNLRSSVSVRCLNHTGFSSNIQNLVFWAGSAVSSFVVIECMGYWNNGMMEYWGWRNEI